MGTLHTVRYRQPQTQSTPGLSHNGLLLNVGSPGVSLPDGPVHGLLLGRPRWRLLRLRLGRRIRLWLSIRLRWYVGNAWLWLWSGHCPSYRARHALVRRYRQSGLLSHHHIRLLSWRGLPLAVACLLHMISDC